MNTVLDIAEVSAASGVAASAIRFYEEKGLIRSVGRKGLRRLFHAAVLERLAVIGLARAAGFSIGEIKALVAPKEVKLERGLLMAKAQELDAHIKNLTALRNGLRHAAACSAPNHMECPKFLRILNVSQRKQLKTRSKKGALFSQNALSTFKR